jgi:hypothetical protein
MRGAAGHQQASRRYRCSDEHSAQMRVRHAETSRLADTFYAEA